MGAYGALGSAATRTGITDDLRARRDAYAAGGGSRPEQAAIRGNVLTPPGMTRAERGKGRNRVRAAPCSET
jgi:hypothetical protein